MDKSVQLYVAQKNVERFREALRECIEGSQAHDRMLKLIEAEERQLALLNRECRLPD
jgi:hypothetical protein